jgi:hypothetical protein
MILLGWEIGTGRRVEIPDTGHLAWFGQTQLSGKTTALEAIAYRGELRAVAFITKQGEGGFLTGRMISPYFSEPTNDEEQPLWRWVKSILEASQQRKLNFEEAWIIRCCEDPRSARTLKDVHENIKALLGGEGGYVEKGRGKKKKKEWKYTRKPVSGINAGVYTSLKAYFDIVMPQLARLPYTKKLTLHDGLNVMDLREYAMETQALVIRSVMEWVYQHEKGVRVIVPEAQDFVPQGKNSPVKMACETLVRKAGANKNFMWLDSQDMAAVDKIMLRACSIVGIGVQTEAHEIDRSLDGLFMPQLRPVDIARLKIGEFFVRTPEAKVSKVYVQPAWMNSELHAQAIAKGEESVSSARQMLRAFKDSHVMIHDGIKTPGKTTPLQLLQVQIQEVPDGDVESNSHSDAQDHIPGKELDLDHVRFQPGRGPDVRSGTLEDLSGGEQSEKIPSPQILNENPSRAESPLRVKEPGKDEKPFTQDVQGKQPFTESTTQSGDSGAGEAVIPSEGASGEIPLDASVSGTLFRGQFYPDGASRHANESEASMPQAKTSAEVLTALLDTYNVARNMPNLESPLRALLKEHAALIEAHDALAARVRAFEDHEFERDERISSRVLDAEKEIASANGNSLEKIYAYVKERAAIDPGILEILSHRPEIRVKVERQIIHAKGDTMDGRLALLVHEGFFDKQKNRADVGAELRRRGVLKDKANLKILSPYLAKLTSYGFLTREGDSFRAVAEMKKQVAVA